MKKIILFLALGVFSLNSYAIGFKVGKTQSLDCSNQKYKFMPCMKSDKTEKDMVASAKEQDNPFKTKSTFGGFSLK